VLCPDSFLSKRELGREKAEFEKRNVVLEFGVERSHLGDEIAGNGLETEVWPHVDIGAQNELRWLLQRARSHRRSGYGWSSDFSISSSLRGASILSMCIAVWNESSQHQVLPPRIFVQVMYASFRDFHSVIPSLSPLIFTRATSSLPHSAHPGSDAAGCSFRCCVDASHLHPINNK
jgi:hypothetical protein